MFCCSREIIERLHSSEAIICAGQICFPTQTGVIQFERKQMGFLRARSACISIPSDCSTREHRQDISQSTPPLKESGAGHT